MHIEKGAGYSAALTKLLLDIMTLRQALKKVRDWELPECSNGHSYSGNYGSLGAEQYIRSLAADALEKTE